MFSSNNTRFTILNTIIILWVAHFLIDLMIGIWPVYKSLVQLDLSVAGLIAGFCGFAGEGMQLLFGSLSDRGHRKALILSGVLLTTSALFFAYTENYLFLFFLLLLTCLGSGAFHPTAASLMGNLAENKKGLFITFFASGGALGMALSQVFYSNLMEFFHHYLYLMIIPSILLVLWAFFQHFPEMKKIKENEIEKLDFSAFNQFFRRKDLRSLYFSQMANQTLFWGLVFLLPDVLLAKNYDSWICYGGGHMAFILGGAFMMIPGGYLADKYSAKSVILGASFISFLFFYFFLFSPLLSSWIIIALLAVLGGTLGIVNPVTIALGNKLVPDKPGQISAYLMGLVWCISEALGPGGGGVLCSFFEDDAPIMALAILGLFFILGIFMAQKLPKEVSEFAVEKVEEIV